MRNPPVLILAGGALVALVVAIVSAVRASGLAEEAARSYSPSPQLLQEAASLAAASNLWITLFGVAVIGLLVVWAVYRSIRP